MSNPLIPEYVKVPKEALVYKPPPNIVFFGKGKSAQRFIFRDQELTPFENEKLSRLELELAKAKVNPFILHPTWNRNDVLRFCYGTGWKTRVAKEALCKYLKWKQTIMPSGYLTLYPRVSKILETGCIYIHGRDMHYRPIMVINFNRFNIKRFSIEEYIHMIAFLLDYLIENMLLPGKVENWVVISDFERNGFGELGFSSLKQVMGILTDNYRCRLGCNYVINPAKAVYYMWTCMKPFLDEVLIEKVKILNKPHPAELFNHCNPYQVEEKYGGRAQNIHTYWPPIMPNAPYNLNGVPQQSLEVPFADKSYESELNPVDDDHDISPKRRSLSISGAFEAAPCHNQNDDRSYIESNKIADLEEEEAKQRRELRRQKKIERKRRKAEKKLRLDPIVQVENLEEICEIEQINEPDNEIVQVIIKSYGISEQFIENDSEPQSYSPANNLIINENDGPIFESTRTDISCGICSIPSVKTCSLF